MNKNQLIDKISEETGQSKKDTNDFLVALVDSIQNAVANDDAVTLVGFGTFSKAHRKATTGRNPRTGEVIQIKASNQPKFKAGKAFKDAVN